MDDMDGFQEIVMIGILMIGVFAALYFWRLHYEVEGIRIYRKEKFNISNILLLLSAALLIKCIFSVSFEGHGTDMNCFYGWSNMIFENGIGEFYYLDAFTDYPPGYMAILWVIAAIRNLFSIETAGAVGRLLIKLVPVLADLGAGALLYTIAKKKFSETSSLLLAVTYVLNPIVVLDSSVWGQTDGVFTFFVLLTCMLCMEEKRIPAYFAFVVGVLIKPQTLIFAPILIWTIIEQVFLKDFNVKKMLTDLAGGLVAIGTMILMAVPFGLEKVFAQYVDTLGSYEYCSVNAYNFWTLLGKNWAEQSSGSFLFLEYKQWGTVAIFVSVALSALIFFKLKEDKSKYFLSMSVIVSTMFLFSVRMHERYLFPVVVLTLAGFLVKPAKELFVTYVGFSFVQLINVGHVLYYFEEFESTGPTGGVLGITAVLTLLVYAYMYFAITRKSIMPGTQEMPKKGKNGKDYIVQPKKQEKKPAPEKKKFTIMASKVVPKFTKWDWIVLVSIMTLYSAFALFNLGNMYAPQTQWSTEQNGKEIVLDLGEQKKIDMMYAFLGNYENRKFIVDFSHDGESYERLGEVNICSVFAWNHLYKVTEDGSEEASYNTAKEYRYVKLTAQDDKSVLRELTLTDADGNVLTPVNVADYPELFDEQEMFDPLATLQTGTYFDEIYHARTAYEMTQEGMYCYENTHPPLGKFLISIGIRVFGMNPFGWRIIGVLFGIAMLPFMYLFGKRMFNGLTWAAGGLTFLFAFDFMHFTQTRISTIDVYGTFFIIAMYFFMYQYSQMSFYDTPLKKTFVPLGLSAVMMGLGCASKWTAVYAAAGLAVFFFAIMWVRYREYRLACLHPGGTTAGIQHKHIIDVFGKNLKWTIVFCVIFFVIVAGIIYICSYIPFSDGTNSGVIDRMLKNQQTMFDYHSQLKSDHPYSSTWSEWPTMIRPMFYYCKTLANGLKEGISAFGNPLVWWAGIPASLYMVYLIIREKDRTALFMVFAYLVQYVPWMLVPRCTFAYHYFPSVPFVAMMIVYIMVRLVQKDKKWLKWAFVYFAIAFLLFLLFYPVLSGYPIENNMVRDGLRWLSDWVLIY